MLRSSQYEFEGLSFEVFRPRARSTKRKEKAKPSPDTAKTVIVTYKDAKPDADELELWLEDTDNKGGNVDRIEHDQVNRRFLVVFKDLRGELASEIRIIKYMYKNTNLKVKKVMHFCFAMN